MPKKSTITSFSVRTSSLNLFLPLSLLIIMQLAITGLECTLYTRFVIEINQFFFILPDSNYNNYKSKSTLFQYLLSFNNSPYCDMLRTCFVAVII